MSTPTAKYAWKLPVFAFFYIVASYLAAGFAHVLGYALPYNECWQEVWNAYATTWSHFTWPFLPLWLLSHGCLLLVCIRYYSTGTRRNGFWLMLFTFLCSATGGDMLFSITSFILYFLGIIA